MKKFYIVMAVLATAVFGSCQREKDIKDLTPVGENEVALWLRSDAGTRAGNGSAQSSRGAVIPLGKAENGSAYFLEETVVNLDATAPVTRGTPAYTENVGTLYESDMFVHVEGGSFADAIYQNMDGDIVQGAGWRYRHKYDNDPWPTGGEAVDFYLRMPSDMAGVVKRIGEEPFTCKSGSFKFDYVSPLDVKDMEDILFAYRSIDKTLHDQSLPNGVPVLFKHALTGVKFAIGNDSDDIRDNGIAIKEIIFNGIKDKGTCTIKPTPEDETYQDTDTHSSAGDVKWEDVDYDVSGGTPYSTGVLGKTVDGKFVPDALVDYDSGSFANNGKYPTSFSDGGNLQNLNDADATKTFWFIPQAITDAVTLTIVYIFDGKEFTWTIDFGATLATANVEWEAGQLRTYTIKVDDVNVKIEDKVVPEAHPNTVLTKLVDGVETPVLDKDGKQYMFTAYDGTKSDIVITNTGNTDAFIRAAIIGQWLEDVLDIHGQVIESYPVFGFTDFTEGNYESVESWYQDQFVSKTHRHGEFSDLAGYSADYKGDWVYDESDGFYYYKNVVKVGEAVPEPLFTQYEVKKTPAVAVAGSVKEVYFVLEIATQAVSAKKLDGSYYTYDQAWSNAKAQAQNQ